MALVSSAVGYGERIPRYIPLAISVGVFWESDWYSTIRLCSILRRIWLEFSRWSFWAALGVLLRSDSRLVARGGRPNKARKELVMLPSGNAVERWFAGIKVNGSGIGLEYFSVAPVSSSTASISTSASSRRSGYEAKLATP